MIVYVIMGGMRFDCCADDASIKAIYTNKEKSGKSKRKHSERK